MAINAGDILYYNGAAWVNNPGVQLGASGFSLVGESDTIQLQVTGYLNQGNALADIQTILNYPSSPATESVFLLQSNGQASITFVDNTTGLGYPLRLNRQTSASPTAMDGFGPGIQFYGQNTSHGEAQVAAIQVSQQGFSPGLENANLIFFTTANALTCLWNANGCGPRS